MFILVNTNFQYSIAKKKRSLENFSSEDFNLKFKWKKTSIFEFFSKFRSFFKCFIHTMFINWFRFTVDFIEIFPISRLKSFEIWIEYIFGWFNDSVDSINLIFISIRISIITMKKSYMWKSYKVYMIIHGFFHFQNSDLLKKRM